MISRVFFFFLPTTFLMAQFICKKFYMCIMNVNMNSSNSTCEKTFSVAVRYSRRIILIEECRFWRHFPDKRHFFFFLIVTRMFFPYNGYVTALSIKTPNRPMPRAWFRIGFICTFFPLGFYRCFMFAASNQHEGIIFFLFGFIDLFRCIWGFRFTKSSIEQ